LTDEFGPAFDRSARSNDSTICGDGTEAVETQRTRRRAALEALERELSAFLANASR
jgi:hypothetical protein